MKNYVLKQLNLQFTCDPNLLRKFWTNCRAVNIEISAVAEAEVTILPDGLKVHISDRLHMLRQKGHIGGTHLDMNALADLVHDYGVAGRSFERLRVWLHKHPGSVYFSPTDEMTIHELCPESMNPLIAGVFNEEGDMHWGIVHNGKMLIEFDTEITLPEPSKEEIDVAREMLKPIVKEMSLADFRFRGTPRSTSHLRSRQDYMGSGYFSDWLFRSRSYQAQVPKQEKDEGKDETE